MGWKPRKTTVWASDWHSRGVVTWKFKGGSLLQRQFYSFTPYQLFPRHWCNFHASNELARGASLHTPSQGFLPNVKRKRFYCSGTAGILHGPILIENNHVIYCLLTEVRFYQKEVLLGTVNVCRVPFYPPLCSLYHVHPHRSPSVSQNFTPMSITETCQSLDTTES